MKTAPFDREPPFVLLPKRPSIWRKLISLISLKRVGGRFKQPKSFAQSANQFASGIGAASQVSGYNNLVSSAWAVGKNCTGNQFNGNSAALDAIRGGVVKINEWGGNVPQNFYNAGGLNGALAHNDSYNFYEWDNAKGCMVPYEPSTPLIQRFQRSFDAFMRSWRLG